MQRLSTALAIALIVVLLGVDIQLAVNRLAVQHPSADFGQDLMFGP